MPRLWALLLPAVATAATNTSRCDCEARVTECEYLALNCQAGGYILQRNCQAAPCGMQPANTSIFPGAGFRVTRGLEQGAGTGCGGAARSGLKKRDEDTDEVLDQRAGGLCHAGLFLGSREMGNATHTEIVDPFGAWGEWSDYTEVCKCGERPLPLPRPTNLQARPQRVSQYKQLRDALAVGVD